VSVEGSGTKSYESLSLCTALVETHRKRECDERPGGCLWWIWRGSMLSKLWLRVSHNTEVRMHFDQKGHYYHSPRHCLLPSSFYLGVPRSSSSIILAQDFRCICPYPSNPVHPAISWDAQELSPSSSLTLIATPTDGSAKPYLLDVESHRLTLNTLVYQQIAK
jgi:hypothetical protein